MPERGPALGRVAVALVEHRAGRRRRRSPQWRVFQTISSPSTLNARKGTTRDSRAPATLETGNTLEREQILRVDCSVAQWRARQWKWGVSGAPANVRDGHPASYTRRKAFSPGNNDVRPISKDTQWLYTRLVAFKWCYSDFKTMSCGLDARNVTTVSRRNTN